jgi:hypothetical protein
MKTINSLSGGKTSSYMAIHYPADVNIFACVCIDDPICMPKYLTVLDNAQNKLNGNFIASAESEKTLKIMMQLEQKIGKEIVWVRGKSFDEIINNAGCLPTWNRRFCTTDMKIKPMTEYLYFRYGIVKEQIGFRYDELQRAYEIKKGEKSKLKVEKYFDFATETSLNGNKRNKWEKNVLVSEKSYPLITNRIEKYQIEKYWKNYPEFIFPEDSNCQGCHHKSPKLIKQNYIREPKILEWFARQEEKGKYNTWHDDMIPYRKKFEMEFTGQFDFEGTSCDMGGCTD